MRSFPGSGVRLLDGLEALERRYDVEAVSTPSGVTHLAFTRCHLNRGTAPHSWTPNRRHASEASPTKRRVEDPGDGPL